MTKIERRGRGRVTLDTSHPRVGWQPPNGAVELSARAGEGPARCGSETSPLAGGVARSDRRLWPERFNAVGGAEPSAVRAAGAPPPPRPRARARDRHVG